MATIADFKVTELDVDFDFDSLDYWDVVIIGAGPAGDDRFWPDIG